MKRRILFPFIFLGLLIFSLPSAAQISLLPTDTAICPGQTYTIHASFSSAYSPNNTDDYFSDDTVNIGFPFVFYGDTVTQCVVSANNFISFDLSYAGQHSAWTYSTAKNNGELSNVIMFPFQDLNFGTFNNPGVISHQTFGSAPNRKFVIEFCTVPLFDCNSYLVTDELILYEGTNIIEMHTKSKPAGCSWNGGTGIQGLIHNTLSDLVPGRDVANVNWGATNDARRFTPNGITAYTIDTINFNPVPILQNADSNEVVWYEEGNPNPIDTGASLTVTVSSNINYYVAQITGRSCNDTTDYTFSDTTWLHNATQFDTLDINICQGEEYNFFGRILDYSGTFDTAFTNTGGCDSFIRVNLHVNPLPIVTLTDTMSIQYFCKGALGQLSIDQPSTSYHYQWKINGSNVPGGTNATLNTANPGDFQLFVTTTKGCKDSSKIITLNKDSVHIDFNPIPLLGCGTDSVKIVNNSEPGSMYKWDFGDGAYPLDTTEAPTHIYNHQGTYYIHLLMADSLGCVDSLTKFVDLNHPLNADFTVSVDSICQGEAAQVQFTNTSIGAQHYEWHFADGSPISAQESPNHNFTLAGSHNVMLIASDSIPCYDTAYHNIYVDSLPFLYVIPDKTHLCIGEKLNLRLNYLSETATDVNWDFGDGIHWKQSDSAAHSFDKAGNYTVTVTVNHLVCPPTEDTLSISVSDLPIVNFGADTVLCLQGSPILLQNVATNAPGTQYRWNTGDSSATLSVVHPGYYALTATLSDCSTTEGITINKDCYVDIPNAFTPNGDGQNDYFFPRQYLSKGATSFTLSIFNRWGQKVFETAKTDGRGWDGKFNGKEQPNGVYIYQMEVIYTNGRSEKYSGNVTLIR